MTLIQSIQVSYLAMILINRLTLAGTQCHAEKKCPEDSFMQYKITAISMTEAILKNGLFNGCPQELNPYQLLAALYLVPIPHFGFGHSNSFFFNLLISNYWHRILEHER